MFNVEAISVRCSVGSDSGRIINRLGLCLIMYYRATQAQETRGTPAVPSHCVFRMSSCIMHRLPRRHPALNKLKVNMDHDLDKLREIITPEEDRSTSDLKTHPLALALRRYVWKTIEWKRMRRGSEWK